MVNLQLSFALPLILSAVVARATPAAPVADNIFPITFVGSIVVPESSSGDTRIYYQKADNGIGEVAVTGPFTSGHVFGGNGNLIPAAQVLPGTPIATAVLGDNWAKLHVFFVSPTHILSEWIWEAALNAWRGGPTCSDCITVNGFTVQLGSQVLFATANNSPSSPALLRVAFVSSGAPNTLSEASFTTARGWQLAQLST
ncbi:hypothetical protein DFH09DRAFT_1316642 [Mycena vulgaris]|nr:hypothetical protein DFH09DRAFT_1316642 [Mycena vulgaris]